eukprot:m.48097 g.48097  ORF g.48097 m.48097 type:complete len:149 (-) comp20667_c0_seq2:293-739(-)
MTQLKELLFGVSHQFWTQYYATNNFSEVNVSTWANNTRNINYIMPKKGMRPKTRVLSKEIIVIDHPDVVVVEIDTQTPDVPYGKLFRTKVQYVFQQNTKTESSITTTASVEWSQSCVLKSTITKKVKEGVMKDMVCISNLARDVWEKR